MLPLASELVVESDLPSVSLWESVSPWVLVLALRLPLASELELDCHKALQSQADADNNMACIPASACY